MRGGEIVACPSGHANRRRGNGEQGTITADNLLSALMNHQYF
jgi:hypothetical protein